MAEKFTFHDEVIALLLTDDAAAQRFALILKDYAFPSDHQNTVAEQLLKFTSVWNAAPKEHAYELVEEEHRPYLRELSDLSKNVHRDYVLSRLDQFLREGAIRRTVLKALDHLQMGEWDEVEQAFNSYSRHRATTFDTGIRLRGDALRGLLQEDPDTITFRTGIKALDDAHIGPAPKTLLMFIAPPKRGKSWQLIHQGKTSLIDRKTVFHITLEMPARQVAKRYVQSVLSLTKRQVENIEVTTLVTDNLGRLQGIESERVTRPHLSMNVFDRANEFFARHRLYVKEFPTGTLTVPDLRAYLDTMEQVEGVVPDVLALDYADLMKLDAKNLRIDTGMVVRDLRGVAMEREIALTTASQGNRTSMDAKWVRETDVAEDWSKIMTADTVLTYSQTPEERKLKLGRIFVSNARDEGDKWALLMAQNYELGQFCTDSVRMDDEVYWRIVAEKAGNPMPPQEE